MIELERLHFLSGAAVATILRSPGTEVVKFRLLLAGLLTGVAQASGQATKSAAGGEGTAHTVDAPSGWR